MSKSKPESRAEFREYCLRQLGKPVIEINVETQQVEDRIDEAVQLYSEFHVDASEHWFIEHAITSQEITAREISLPENTLSVIRVLPITGAMASGMFDIRYQMRLNDPFTYRGTIGGLASYDLTKQYLNMMTQMLAGEKGIRYSRHKDKLKIDTSWDEDFTAGDFIVIEVYRSLDETVYSDIWNDIWLKRYTTSLIKQQWGTNLKKYGGIQLPGGTTLQGQEMYSEAKEEILQLTEELHTMWQDPPSFFVGHIGG